MSRRTVHRFWQMLAVAPVVLVATAQAQDKQEAVAFAKPFFDRWENCVMENARRYAGSLEPAEFIVKTALQTCENIKRDVASALYHGGLKSQVVLYTLEYLEKSVSHKATVAVLEMRR